MDDAARKLALERTIEEFMSTQAHCGTFDLPDDIVVALMKVQTLRDDSSNPDESACAHVPVKPDPHSNSGAIALPTPE